MYYALFAFFVTVFFFLTTSVAWAQTPTCTIIYGGGKIDCEATASATTKPTETPTPSKPATESGQATKGGLPVNEPTNAKKTPDTGPEALALIALLPAAALGFYLRNKFK